MPTSIALGSHFEEFVRSLVSSGRYNNVSEVIREGLRLLEDRTATRKVELDVLREELIKGLESGPPTELDLEEVRAEGRRLLAKRTANRR